MQRASVIAEARLRGRNQLTLPDPVVQAGGLVEGERFVVEIDPAQPETLRLYRIRASYAGSMNGIYGTSEDVVRFLREEHAAWGE